MECSAEEIEKKRKLAQERLSRKLKNSTTSNRLSPFKFKSVNQSINNTVKSHSNFHAKSVHSFSPYIKPQAALSFYGNSSVTTGKCVLISENRFAIELSTYCSPAIEIFKLIKSRSYNTKTKQWDFDMNDYNLLLQKLTDLQPDVIVTRLPTFVIKCCTMCKPDYSTVDLSCIDKELSSILMPFQVDGVCFGIDKNGRCLIADEMGLGKTLQALAIADYYRNDWPLLIITTSSMKNEWESTIHKYLPSVSIMHTQYMTSAKDYIGDCKVLIVSYELMTRCVEKLLERQFKVLIVDESHTLKNFKTKCTQAATELAKNVKRIILLSGTPALSRPKELYTQLALIDEKFFGNFYDYSKRYCDGKSSNFGWDATGQSNLQELEIILNKKFMIRRTKEDVLKTLPNKEQQIIELDVNLKQLSEEEKSHLNTLASQYVNQKGSKDKHTALVMFFAETGRIKIPSVCSFILQTLKSTKKFIVFAHHQKMLDAIEKVLKSKTLKFIRIDGNTTSTQRKYFVDKFQLDDEYICAILSITAANAGITLTAAKLVIFAELHWNPSILSQAESRAHRIGQDEKVIVKYLLAPRTADDLIWPILQSKQKILKEAGLFKDSFENLVVTKQGSSNNSGKSACERPDELINNVKDSSNIKEICNDFHSVELEFFNDDFDDTFIHVDVPNSSNKENIDNAMKSKMFNDDFDEILINHSLDIGEYCNNSSGDDGMEVNLLNDGCDDILSNVQLNI